MSSRALATSCADEGVAHVVRVPRQELHCRGRALRRARHREEKERLRDDRRQRDERERARPRVASLGNRARTIPIARLASAPSGRISVAPHASADELDGAPGASASSGFGPLAGLPDAPREEPGERHDLHPAGREPGERREDDDHRRDADGRGLPGQLLRDRPRLVRERPAPGTPSPTPATGSRRRGTPPARTAPAASATGGSSPRSSPARPPGNERGALRRTRARTGNGCTRRRATPPGDRASRRPARSSTARGRPRRARSVSRLDGASNSGQGYPVIAAPPRPARKPRPYEDAPRLPEGDSVDARSLVRGEWLELEVGPGRGGFVLERLAAEPRCGIVGLEVRRKWASIVDARVAKRGLGARGRVFAEDAKDALAASRTRGRLRASVPPLPRPVVEEAAPEAPRHGRRLPRGGGAPRRAAGRALRPDGRRGARCSVRDPDNR